MAARGRGMSRNGRLQLFTRIDVKQGRLLRLDIASRQCDGDATAQPDSVEHWTALPNQKLAAPLTADWQFVDGRHRGLTGTPRSLRRRCTRIPRVGRRNHDAREPRWA